MAAALAILLAVALAAAIPARAARYRRGTWVPVAGARHASLVTTCALISASGPEDIYLRLVATISAIIYAGLEVASWLDLLGSSQPGRHSRTALVHGAGA